MYISTCQRQLEQPSLTFLTPEEHYDYAVSQLNTGYYEEAREQFNSILSGHPDADYAFYGLAVLDAITGPLAGLPRQPGPRHRAESAETGCRPASTTTFKAWWTIPASPNCCILKFRKACLEFFRA